MAREHIRTLIRPEVADYSYAYLDGQYWRCERHYNGAMRSLVLGRPPVGQIALDVQSGRWFVVPGPARMGIVQILSALAVGFAVPLAWLLMPNSSPAMRLVVGAGFAGLAIFQVFFERLRDKDPTTANRIAQVAAVDLAFHVLSHHLRPRRTP